MSSAHASGVSAPAAVVTIGGAPTSATVQPLALTLPGSAAAPMAGHFQEQMLSVLARRQEVLASNIANADTPNYLARDIDLPSVALALHQSGATVPLTRTHETHQSLPTPTPSEPLRYSVPQQGAVDGNTVEMDLERAKFAENALRYEFALGQVSGHYKMMKELLDAIR